MPGIQRLTSVPDANRRDPRGCGDLEPGRQRRDLIEIGPMANGIVRAKPSPSFQKEGLKEGVYGGRT